MSAHYYCTLINITIYTSASFFRWESVGEKKITSGSWWPREGTAHRRVSWAAQQKPQMSLLTQHLARLPYFRWRLYHLPSVQVESLASHGTPTSRSPRNSTLYYCCIYSLISLPKVPPTLYVDSGFSSLNWSPYLLLLSKTLSTCPPEFFQANLSLLPHLKSIAPPYFQDKV